jgi:hypothetical protein
MYILVNKNKKVAKCLVIIQKVLGFRSRDQVATVATVAIRKQRVHKTKTVREVTGNPRILLIGGGDPA